MASHVDNATLTSRKLHHSQGRNLAQRGDSRKIVEFPPLNAGHIFARVHSADHHQTRFGALAKALARALFVRIGGP